MNPLRSNPDGSRTEWIRRFAYRAMLCRNELDTTSALTIADIQFEGLQDVDPEAAAEAFVNRAPYNARRSPGRPEPQPARHSFGSLSPA